MDDNPLGVDGVCRGNSYSSELRIVDCGMSLIQVMIPSGSGKYGWGVMERQTVR